MAMNWKDYCLWLEQSFEGSIAKISACGFIGNIIFLDRTESSTNKKKAIFEDVFELGRIEGLITNVDGGDFDESVLYLNHDEGNELKICLNKNKWPILIVFFNSIDNTNSLLLLHSMFKNCGFSELEIRSISNLLSVFKWHSPCRFNRRFIEVNLDYDKSFKVNSDFIEKYISLNAELFGWKPSKRQISIDIFDQKKLWFGDMNSG